jgi:hypothetical protein
MPHDPIAVWATMEMKTWPETYWFAHVPPTMVDRVVAMLSHQSKAYAAINQDQNGFSLVVDDARWQRFFGDAGEIEKYGPVKVISTDSDLPFDVTGFIQAALRPINGAGFKAAPQCGIMHDHFVVPAGDIGKVEEIFESFRAWTRSSAAS